MKKEMINVGFALNIIIFLIFIATNNFIDFFSKDSLKIIQYVGIGVTVACFIIMTIIILEALKNKIGKAKKIKIDLDDARKKLESIKKENGQTIKEILLNHEIFEDEFLSGKIEEYYKASSQYKNYKKDISDFISIEIIDEEINRDYLDRIPGIMTGLGILGTFIGLVVGLYKFDINNPNTISDLLEGIKTAFYTSVFGMIYSLSFHHSYEKECRKLYDSVERFLDSFHEKIAKESKTDASDQLLTNQKEQTSLLNQLTENITSQLSESISNCLVPTMNDIKVAIEATYKNVAETQTEGIEKVVDKFLGQMDDAVGNQFSNLGETIESLCQWQKDMTKNTQYIVDDIVASSKDITKMTDRLDVLLERFEKSIADMTECNSHTTNNLDTMMQLENVFSETLNNFNDVNLGVKEYIKILRETNEKSEEHMSTIVNDIHVQLDASSEKLVAVCNQLNDNINRSMSTSVEKVFKLFDDGLSDIAGHLSGTISEIKDVTKQVPTAMQTSFDNIEKQLMEYKEIVEKTQEVTGKYNTVLESKLVNLENIDKENVILDA